MRRGQRVVGPPAAVRAVRAHRVLRHLPCAARVRPCGRQRAPVHPQLRARRRLVLQLRVQGHVRGAGAGTAGESPACPAGARARRTGAGRLALPRALSLYAALLYYPADSYWTTPEEEKFSAGYNDVAAAAATSWSPTGGCTSRM